MPAPLSLTVRRPANHFLCVVFEFISGRFEQTITLRSGDGETVHQWRDAFASENEDWPGSPPIQQLSLESIRGAMTLLGVGQAGKSHWSVSVETVGDGDDAVLRFDVACRTSQVPEWLGSRYYELVAPSVGHPAMKLHGDRVTPEAILVELAIALPVQVPPLQKMPPNKPLAKTHRWCYRVS